VLFLAWRDTAGETCGHAERLADFDRAAAGEFVRASASIREPLWLCRRWNSRALRILRALPGGGGVLAAVFSEDVSQVITLRQPPMQWWRTIRRGTCRLAVQWKMGRPSRRAIASSPSRAKWTPMTAYSAFAARHEPVFPRGVVNILHGKGAKMGRDHHASDIAASRSTAAPYRMEIYNTRLACQKVSLELGGKEPDYWSSKTPTGKKLSGRERPRFAIKASLACAAPHLGASVMLRPIQKGLIEQSKSIVIGDPFQESPARRNGVQMHMDKVLNIMTSRKKEGGAILMGGKRRMVEGRGRWLLSSNHRDRRFASSPNQSEEIFARRHGSYPFSDGRRGAGQSL